jgi:hypothetical protein
MGPSQKHYKTLEPSQYRNIYPKHKKHIHFNICSLIFVPKCGVGGEKGD